MKFKQPNNNEDKVMAALATAGVGLLVALFIFAVVETKGIALLVLIYGITIVSIGFLVYTGIYRAIQNKRKEKR